MMRLRRASAIAAFSLLTSAATAYAECAWVLWEKWDRMPEKKGAWTGKLQTAWEIKAALPKFEQCHDALKRAWNRGIENQKTASKEARSGAEVFFKPEEVGFYHVQGCYVDL